MQVKITLLSIQTKIRPVLRQNAYIIYITISFLFSFQQRRFAFENSIFCNGTAHHIFHSGNLIHHFCHDLFNNRTESAGTRIPFDGFLRNSPNRFLLKNKLHIVHAEKFLVLADKSVFRFRQDSDKRFFFQRVESYDDRKSADKFRNKSEFQEVFRFYVLKNFRNVFLIGFLDIRAKSHRAPGRSAGDDFIYAGKGSAADEEDI